MVNGNKDHQGSLPKEPDAATTFRTVFEHCPDAIFLADADSGIIIDANQAACELMGMPRDAIVGLPQTQLHPHQEAELYRAIFREHVQKGEAFTEDIYIQHASGQLVPVDISTSMVDVSGKQIIQGVFRDITERKRAEAALEASEQRYRQIVEEAIDVVYTTDSKGYFTYANPPTRELTGYSPEELVGSHFNKLIPESWRERVQSCYQKQFDERQNQTTLEFPILTRSGEEKWVEQTVRLLAAGDWVTGFQSIVRDISPRKRAEEELRRRNEELAALNAVAKTVAQSLDLHQILDRALDKVLDVMEMEVGLVRLLEVETNEMVLVAYRGLSDEFAETVRRRALGEGVVGTVISSAQPLLIGDLSLHPQAHDLRKTLENQPVRSLVAVPLKSREQVMGILAVASSSPREFSSEDAELLPSIGSQIGMAIENARLYERQEQRSRELMALHETSLHITSRLDLDSLLEAILAHAARLLDGQTGEVYLYRPAKGDLISAASRGMPPELDDGIMQAGEGVAGKVLETDQPVIVDNYDSWAGRSEAYAGYGFSRVVGSPIKYGEQFLGVLIVDRLLDKSPFSGEEVNLLGLLANQAAIAIENARLHDETKRRLEELSAIEEIVDELSSTLDFDKMMRLVLDKALEATHTSVGAIAVVDEDRTDLLLLAHQSYPARTDAQGQWRWDIDQGIVGRVVRTGELSIVDDVSQDSDYAELISETRSQLTVPILRDDKVAGAIVLESPQLAGFTQEQAAFVQHLAEHAAIATANARLYERVRESEERYRAYVENVPDAIWETDADGRFTYWSPQIENLTGYTPQDLLGHTAYEFFMHPDDTEEFRNSSRQLVEQGKEGFALRHRALHRDGTILHMEISIKPVWDDSGQVIQYRGVARDVSDRVRLQAQLIQSAKLSGIGQMISGVAHELNNPLTTVMGYSQLLQASDVDEDVKEDLQRIYEDALRAQRIVQNLLTFARQKKPQRSPVDINEVIERTLALRRYQLEVDDVDLVTELAENLPWTSADSYQLQQVFLNIVNNAHQAMLHQDEGGVLTVRSELLDGDVIRVSFANTGPGIPPDVQDRVFDPFFTTKDVGVGTGLGLSISHGIVQEHDGRIWVESQPGQGATFVIELPVKSWIEDVTGPSPGGEQATTASERQRILVIDDQRSIVDLIVRALTESGYQVDGVMSAEMALEILHHKQYDLIISDIKMPEMDGPACEKEIRAMDPALAERMIFITGDVLNPTTQAFLKEWQGRRIQKPFDVQELTAVVREALS